MSRVQLTTRERIEWAQDRQDEAVVRALPAALSAARAQHDGDVFAMAAYLRFTWANGDVHSEAVARAAFVELRPMFTGLERDVWLDCIEQGAVDSFDAAMASRELYAEAVRREAADAEDAQRAVEAHAA